MDILNRKLEPATTPHQEKALLKYREHVCNTFSNVQSCLSLLPKKIKDNQGIGLHIVDLGGGNGVLCRALERVLPQANITCIDLSLDKLKQNNIGGVKMIHDDLLEFKKYIEQDKDTIIISTDTIHHLEQPSTLFEQFKTLHPKIGLFVKDYIRPTNTHTLQNNMKKLYGYIKFLSEGNHLLSRTIAKLSRQSLLAALSKDEILESIKDIQGLQYKDTNTGITYELTRPILSV